MVFVIVISFVLILLIITLCLLNKNKSNFNDKIVRFNKYSIDLPDVNGYCKPSTTELFLYNTYIQNYNILLAQKKQIEDMVVSENIVNPQIYTNYQKLLNDIKQLEGILNYQLPCSEFCQNSNTATWYPDTSKCICKQGYKDPVVYLNKVVCSPTDANNSAKSFINQYNTTANTFYNTPPPNIIFLNPDIFIGGKSLTLPANTFTKLQGDTYTMLRKFAGSSGTIPNGTVISFSNDATPSNPWVWFNPVLYEGSIKAKDQLNQISGLYKFSTTPQLVNGVNKYCEIAFGFNERLLSNIKLTPFTETYKNTYIPPGMIWVKGYLVDANYNAPVSYAFRKTSGLNNGNSSLMVTKTDCDNIKNLNVVSTAGCSTDLIPPYGWYAVFLELVETTLPEI